VRFHLITKKKLFKGSSCFVCVVFIYLFILSPPVSDYLFLNLGLCVDETSVFYLSSAGVCVRACTCVLTFNMIDLAKGGFIGTCACFLVTVM
jgi:hypothetical protein